MNMNGQHKRILFMISLPQTAEFETCNENVSECINKLREKRVDVCESIHREDLATLNQYDIVIIVAHHDTDEDALLLADGKLSMDDFVNSIPEDFCGELDFSSCYSASAMKAIKDRCPNCHIQASIHQTTLLVRLLAYPYVIDIVNEDNNIEYHDAYMKVLDMILEAASENSEDVEEFENVKLGEEKTSVYSPREVMRNSVFQILVFFHYDSAKEVVKAKAKRRQNNAEICDEFEIPISLRKDDEIAITLSFESTDNANIKVKNDEYTKYVTLKEEIVEEEFIVTLLPDFQCNSFLAQIEFAKDEECFVRTKYFNIDVTDRINKVPADIEMEIPTNDEKIIPQITPSELLNKYCLIFDDNVYKVIRRNVPEEETLFKSIFDNKTISNFIVIPNNKQTDVDTKAFEAGKFIYNNCVSLIEQINNNIDSYINMNNSNNGEIAKRINKSFILLKKRFKELDKHFYRIKFDGKESVRFQNVNSQEFKHIENDFLNMVSDVIYLDCQLYFLMKINKLVYLIDRFKENSKDKEKDRKEREKNKESILNDIKNTADNIFDLVISGGIDKELFDIFSKKANTSMVHPINSSNTTASFLALLLSMVCQKCEYIRRSQKDWDINVLQFMKEVSGPTMKRINDVICLLNNNDVIEEIRNYNQDRDTRISISAYYLLGIKVISVF